MSYEQLGLIKTPPGNGPGPNKWPATGSHIQLPWEVYSVLRISI